MNHFTAKKLSTVSSVGFIGFFPNPLVSEEGLFAVNAAHNVVHILTAAGFLADDRMIVDQYDSDRPIFTHS